MIAATIPALAEATELRVSHRVIQKALATMVFTDEGRKYVRGSRTSNCSFAYLENPEVDSDAGQMRIRARFTGRSGANLFGRCIGMGGSFPAVIRATPYFKNGQIRLKNVSMVSEGEDGFYTRGVCTTMPVSLEKDVRFDVLAEAKRLLEITPPNGLYKQDLQDFRVSDVRVNDEALILQIEFVLALKP
jgi:hypothetical protein